MILFQYLSHLGARGSETLTRLRSRGFESDIRLTINIRYNDRIYKVFQKFDFHVRQHENYNGTMRLKLRFFQVFESVKFVLWSKRSNC